MIVEGTHETLNIFTQAPGLSISNKTMLQIEEIKFYYHAHVPTKHRNNLTWYNTRTANQVTMKNKTGCTTHNPFGITPPPPPHLPHSLPLSTRSLKIDFTKQCKNATKHIYSNQLDFVIIICVNLVESLTQKQHTIKQN